MGKRDGFLQGNPASKVQITQIDFSSHWFSQALSHYYIYKDLIHRQNMKHIQTYAPPS